MLYRLVVCTPRSPRTLIGLLSSLLLLILLSAPLAAQEENEEPVIRRFTTGTVEYRGREIKVAVTDGYRGPLFTLRPLVELLGGELRIEPLGKGHTLTLGDDQVIVGPDSEVMTIGEEIIDLSQKPLTSTTGLQVPLDFLRRAYGNFMSYDFEWDEVGKRLLVDRRAGEELPIEIDWIHSQGTTTLVLAFPRRPRYKVVSSDGTLRIELLGDRIGFERLPSEIDDPLIERIRVGERSVTVEIVEEAAAADPYENDQESRYELVIDIARGARRSQSTETASLTRPSEFLPRPGHRAGGPMRIVIDPGHGGPENGTIGKSGTLEKELTLLLARSLERQLESRLSATVILTRRRDEDLPLEARTAVANENQADLFISLHLNSEPWSSGARGAETYFLNKVASDERAANAAAFENQGEGDSALELMLWDLAQNRHMARSQALAKLIQQELNLTLDLRDRGVKQAPFRVLMGATMPAVLVELGFLSNPEEESKLLDSSYRQRLVQALADAIVRFRSGDSRAAADE